jgi:predicted permease
MNTLWNDLRYAFRTLAKSPGFTFVAVLTLALGIGANTAIFSVVNGVLLSPLPYPQSDRLVLLLESNLRFSRDAISYPNFVDWQRSARSFERMAALMGQQGFDLTSPGMPEHLVGYRISSGFFRAFGVNLALGREFSPQEDQPGEPPVVIISNRLWRERFAGSPRVLGESVVLNATGYTIVGVAPAGFVPLINHQDIFVPLGQGDPLILGARGSHDNMIALGRLNPAVSVGQAQTEMSSIQVRLDKLYPDANRGTGTVVVPLKQVLVGRVRSTLLLLLGAVALVLLIACANVANLLLARSAARRREFAVRIALGASRLRVVRQLLTESTLLSLAGGVLGLIVAKWGARAVLATVVETLPRSENVAVNTAVLLFTLGVSVAVGILFGLSPALKSSKADLQSALKEAGRGATSVHHRAQSSLVIVQMALTMMLLAGAGLLFRTLRQLWQTNPGFDMHKLIAFKVSLPPPATKSGASTRAAVQQLIERIRAVPGVQAADLTMLVPLTRDDNDAPFWINSRKPTVIQNAPRMLVFNTGPDYVRTLRIPLLQGRFFTAEDTLNTQCVTVIDRDFANLYFSTQNPIGQTLTFGWDPPIGPCSIIGVVGHVRHFGLDESAGPTRAESYFPLYQIPDRWWPVSYPDLSVVVRPQARVAAVLPAIREAIYGQGQTMYDLETMRDIASESMSSQRLPMILLGTFAALALLLASIGIYGVISYSVTQRIHEIGVRMALGAAKRDIFGMVIGQGLWLAITGLTIGIIAALILNRLLVSFSGLLYGVRPGDPLTFIVVSLVLASVAVLACFIPARRAASVNPVEALRAE